MVLLIWYLKLRKTRLFYPKLQQFGYAERTLWLVSHMLGIYIYIFCIHIDFIVYIYYYIWSHIHIYIYICIHHKKVDFYGSFRGQSQRRVFFLIRQYVFKFYEILTQDCMMISSTISPSVGRALARIGHAAIICNLNCQDRQHSQRKG